MLYGDIIKNTPNLLLNEAPLFHFTENVKNVLLSSLICDATQGLLVR